MKSVIRARFVSLRKENEFWLVDSRLREALERDVLSRISGLAENEGNRIVKSSSTRNVLHLPGTDDRPGIYLKCHRLRNWRERLLDRARPSRAEREFSNLLRIEHYALPGPRALALGEIRSTEMPVRRFLAVEEIPDTRLIPDIIASTDAEGASNLCGMLGKWAAGLHAAGMDHRDLQPGNILVTSENGDYGFIPIDMHSLRFDPDIPVHIRCRTLAPLAGYLENAAGSTGFDSFAEAYLETASLENDFVRSLRNAVIKAKKRRTRSRSARCTQNSSKFTVENADSCKLYRRRDFPQKNIEKINSAIDEKGDSVRLLADTSRTTSYMLSLNNGGKNRNLFVKKFSPPTVAQSLRELIIGRRSLRAYRAGHGLAVRGIPTPAVKACVRDANGGLLVTEFLDKVKLLDDVVHELFVSPRLQNTMPDHAKRRKFIKSLVEAVRRLHNAGIYHPDLKAKNILVRNHGDSWKFYFVDLTDVRFTRPSRRRIIKNLVQLNASMPYCIGDSARLRFLAEYCRGIEHAEKRSMISGIARGTRLRIARWRKLIEKSRKSGT